MGRKSDGGSAVAVGVIAVLAAPYFVALHWPLFGWGIAIFAALLALGSLQSADRSWLVFGIASWALVLSSFGLWEAYFGESTTAQRTAQPLSSPLAEPTKRELEREKARKLKAGAIQTELNRPSAERIDEALGRLESASAAHQEAAVRYALWLAETLSEEADPPAKLKRLKARAAGAKKAVVRRKQRESNAWRTLVCRDGSSSGCLCRGSHRGCCSSHGGVARCEAPTKQTLRCRETPDDGVVEEHLKTSGRWPL